MDIQRFGEAYPPLTDPVIPTHPERRELLRAPRYWMNYFTDILAHYFEDGSVPQFETFTRQIDRYSQWSNDTVDPIRQRLVSLNNPAVPNNIESEMNFHRLNKSLVFNWVQLFYPELLIQTPATLEMVQKHLALQSLSSIRRLAELNKEWSIDHRIQERNDLVGYLGEVDTATVTHELQKTHPELVTIPAPHRYERSRTNSHNNIDFITFDIEKGQARGLQVKGSVLKLSRVKHYNSDFVTVIDAAVDLQTSHFDHDGHITEKFPGQLTLLSLSNAALKPVPPFINSASYMRSRQIAKEIIRPYRPNLPNAVKNIGYRVLHDLYRQPTINPISDIA